MRSGTDPRCQLVALLPSLFAPIFSHFVEILIADGDKHGEGGGWIESPHLLERHQREVVESCAIHIGSLAREARDRKMRVVAHCRIDNVRDLARTEYHNLSH